MSKPDDSLFDDLPEPNSRNNQVPSDDENPFAESLSDDLSDIADDLSFENFVSKDEDEEEDDLENMASASDVFPDLNLDEEDASGENFDSLFKSDSEADDFVSLLSEDFADSDLAEAKPLPDANIEMVHEDSEVEELEVDIFSEPVSEELSFPELDFAKSEQNSDSEEDLAIALPEIEEQEIEEIQETEEFQEISIISEPVSEDLSFPERDLNSDSEQDSNLDLGMAMDFDADVDPFADLNPDSDQEEPLIAEMETDLSDLESFSDLNAVDESLPLEAGMAEVSILVDNPSEKKDKKGKKEKKVKEKKIKLKKEKKPKAPREGGMNKIALAVALAFIVLFALVNLYAVISYGLGALLFLILFDLFAAGVIAVPVFLGKSKEKVSTYDIALAISLVAILLSCMLLLTRLAEYGGQVNTKNFSQKIQKTDVFLNWHA